MAAQSAKARLQWLGSPATGGGDSAPAGSEGDGPAAWRLGDWIVGSSADMRRYGLGSGRTFRAPL